MCLGLWRKETGSWWENFWRKTCTSDTGKYGVWLQITGILIIGVGTTIKAMYNNFDTLLEDRFYSPATLLIAIGCIVFIVASFACCGTIRESTWMIMIVSSPQHNNIFNFLHVSNCYLEKPYSVSIFPWQCIISIFEKL